MSPWYPDILWMNLPVRSSKSPFQQPGVPRAGERDLWWLRRDQWAQLTAPGWEGNRRLDLDEEWMPWMVAVDFLMPMIPLVSSCIISFHLFFVYLCWSIFHGNSGWSSYGFLWFHRPGNSAGDRGATLDAGNCQHWPGRDPNGIRDQNRGDRSDRTDWCCAAFFGV